MHTRNSKRSISEVSIINVSQKAVDNNKTSLEINVSEVVVSQIPIDNETSMDTSKTSVPFIDGVEAIKNKNKKTTSILVKDEKEDSSVLDETIEPPTSTTLRSPKRLKSSYYELMANDLICSEISSSFQSSMLDMKTTTTTTTALSVTRETDDGSVETVTKTTTTSSSSSSASSSSPTSSPPTSPFNRKQRRDSLLITSSVPRASRIQPLDNLDLDLDEDDDVVVDPLEQPFSSSTSKVVPPKRYASAMCVRVCMSVFLFSFFCQSQFIVRLSFSLCLSKV
jgi:hypothetical protein